MVLSHIQASGDEGERFRSMDHHPSLICIPGIWTKHLKGKTELHQTVIDRCLKSLVQKQLIKSIKAVKVCTLPCRSPRFPLTNRFFQHPTRKIYMLYHLQPSVEITGGPWYTDNELDTEFIKLLSSACLRYIKDRVRF